MRQFGFFPPRKRLQLSCGRVDLAKNLSAKQESEDEDDEGEKKPDDEQAQEPGPKSKKRRGNKRGKPGATERHCAASEIAETQRAHGNIRGDPETRGWEELVSSM